MDKIDELLTRAIDTIIPNKAALEKILHSGKKLRIYQGFDPTSPELHIGHMTGLRKLRQWQNLGHEVIFLIGDFTGMVGDPTGKDKTRVPLTKEQVLENAKSYKEQASKILKFDGDNPVIIKYNSEWLAKLSAVELARLTSHLTYQQVIERDMFQRRIKNNMEISISEFLYPFMQGYDSVAMDVDVEIGGSDQLFNMMTGRDLLHKLKRKEKFVMTTPLLTDSTGKKIGKTEGNAIALADPPKELFSKLMSLGDDVIIKCFEYLTDISLKEIASMETAIKNGKNPMIYKKKLAFEIVKQLNDERQASHAQEAFEKVVQQKELPTDIPEIKLDKADEAVSEVLVIAGLASSKSEAKRLIEQGGVEVDGTKIENANVPFETLVKNDQTVIQVGKRRFVKIVIK